MTANSHTLKRGHYKTGGRWSRLVIDPAGRPVAMVMWGVDRMWYVTDTAPRKFASLDDVLAWFDATGTQPAPVDHSDPFAGLDR